MALVYVCRANYAALLVIPESGKLIGSLDDLSNDRYTMLWLPGTRVHIFRDQRALHRDRVDGRTLKVVVSHEPADPPPVRDWVWQPCAGYSWARGQQFLGVDSRRLCDWATRCRQGLMLLTLRIGWS